MMPSTMIDKTTAPLAQAQAQGMEIARFRLKTGVSEGEMLAAHATMVAESLADRPGWHGHEILAMGQGHYVLLCRASGVERAQEICQSWIGDAPCEAFLALIEAEGMEFGAVMGLV